MFMARAWRMEYEGALYHVLSAWQIISGVAIEPTAMVKTVRNLNAWDQEITTATNSVAPPEHYHKRESSLLCINIFNPSHRFRATDFPLYICAVERWAQLKMIFLIIPNFRMGAWNRRTKT
jgi:hypothetical protein